MGIFDEDIDGTTRTGSPGAVEYAEVGPVLIGSFVTNELIAVAWQAVEGDTTATIERKYGTNDWEAYYAVEIDEETLVIEHVDRAVVPGDYSYRVTTESGITEIVSETFAGLTGVSYVALDTLTGGWTEDTSALAVEDDYAYIASGSGSETAYGDIALTAGTYGIYEWHVPVAGAANDVPLTGEIQ